MARNKTDLRSFMSMVNFVRNFIPNISELNAPLRLLLKEHTIFQCLPKDTRVFEKMKVSKARILAVFDDTKELVINTDASKSDG